MSESIVVSSPSELVLEVVSRLSPRMLADGVSVICVVEGAEDGSFVTSIGEDVSDKMHMIDLICQSESLDDALRTLVDAARRDGHDSEVLAELGIPCVAPGTVVVQ